MRTEHIIAEKLGMTVYEMKQKMPVGEMLTWIAYFNESSKPDEINLSDATSDQLKGVFG